MKMVTYPGMNLRGEIRESISFDEDDLSDVEDEVFIRDGKNGYKLAEELNVKRPLMATRRSAKNNVNIRLYGKPPCKAFCKPCCYVLAALSILIGLIVLVVVLVSMFPLPLDRLKDWIIKRSSTQNPQMKVLPCNNLKVTDIWSVNLPKLTSDSPVRTLDVNNDGTEDVLFGFGTGDNFNILPPDIFCSVFLGVAGPCEGGVVALNGINGDIIWRHWTNDTIFSLQCNADINGDQVKDCLAIGITGTIIIINSKNGSVIWQLNTGRNVYIANFIDDQDNDSISDILASHSSLNVENDGHLVLYSGKNGKELAKLDTPNNAKTFYMPEILVRNGSSFVIFGTGTPYTAGNLSVFPLGNMIAGKMTNQTVTIYEDKSRGILTQSILVDITDDGVPDIVTAMYNSSLVAINGQTFKQIWNFTVPGATPETNISPTPAYFNFDNVTDFLIIYQKYDDILNSNYTHTFIINGKSGQPIYNPFTGSIATQMSGLALNLDPYGYDMYLFWTSECTNIEMFKKTDLPIRQYDDSYDECRRQFNTTRIVKLNALGQFHQPPGFEIYNSAQRVSLEYNNFKSVTKHLKEYIRAHPKSSFDSPGQTEINENYSVDSGPIGIRKFGKSSFRHKDRMVHNFPDNPDNNNFIAEDQNIQPNGDDYEWNQNRSPKVNPEFNDYSEDAIPDNQKPLMFHNTAQESSNRDPRSKERKMDATKKPGSRKESTSSRKKNLSEDGGVYGYKNIHMAKKRLMDDVDFIPTEILKDTFVKNKERELRKSRFEQRDVNVHYDKIKEKEEIQKIIEEKLNEMKQNESLNLWQLESEIEMQDWTSGNYRGKREVDYVFDSSTKITTVGAILDSLNTTNQTNSIDIVFITYWLPIKKQHKDFVRQDIQECIEDKLSEKSGDKSHEFQKTTEKEQRALYKQECLEEQANLKNSFSHYNKLHLLRLGQMTVYRLRIECECEVSDKNEKCARFLPKYNQSWPSYLGRLGDGVFFDRG